MGQPEGEVAEHLDVLVLELRETFEVFVGDLVASGAEVGDGIVHALAVPDDEGAECGPERAKLVFLPFAVGPAELAFVAVEDDAGDGVAAFVAGEADARRAASFLAVDPGEQVQGVGEAAELGDRAGREEELDLQDCLLRPAIHRERNGRRLFVGCAIVIARCAAVSRCRLPMLDRVGNVPFAFGRVCRAVVRVGGVLVCPGSSLAGL